MTPIPSGMKSPVVATVGTFDGVHLGHRLVISKLKELAGVHGAHPVVFTFDRHPLSLIAPERAPKRLMTPDEEVEAIESAGCDVVMLSFDERLRQMTAEQWLTNLKEKYGVVAIVMGYDNNFGCDGRRMTADDYREVCGRLGIEMVIAPQLPGVSSTAVRGAIAEGRVKDAGEMLGYPVRLRGTVIHGDAIGRTIGRPTANLQIDSSMLLPHPGVYAAYAYIGGDPARHAAIVNIGTRPTVGGDENRIEANLLDYEGDLYGKEMTLEFADRLRDEERFPDLASLQRQLDADERHARGILG